MDVFGRDLEKWWDAVQSVVRPEHFDVALWRGRVPWMTPKVVQDASVLGWLSAADVSAIERQANYELASRLAARRLLRRMIVAAHGGRSPADVQIDTHCRHCGDPGHGSPMVVAPQLALRRLSTGAAGGRFAVVLGTGSVGVDVESPSRAGDLSARTIANTVPGWLAVERSCPPGSSVVEVWTALEALTKAAGRGLVATEREVDELIATHRLVWLTETDLVTCVAIGNSALTLAIFEPAFDGVNSEGCRQRPS